MLQSLSPIKKKDSLSTKNPDIKKPPNLFEQRYPHNLKRTTISKIIERFNILKKNTNIKAKILEL